VKEFSRDVAGAAGAPPIKLSDTELHIFGKHINSNGSENMEI
jgi:hypothetical protein